MLTQPATALRYAKGHNDTEVAKLAMGDRKQS
jgi:hypothetical protein